MTGRPGPGREEGSQERAGKGLQNSLLTPGAPRGHRPRVERERQVRSGCGARPRRLGGPGCPQLSGRRGGSRRRRPTASLRARARAGARRRSRGPTRLRPGGLRRQARLSRVTAPSPPHREPGRGAAARSASAPTHPGRAPRLPEGRARRAQAHGAAGASTPPRRAPPAVYFRTAAPRFPIGRRCAVECCAETAPAPSGPRGPARLRTCRPEGGARGAAVSVSLEAGAWSAWAPVER